MSVVGVDFGSMNTVIACARNRGVDVITNEVSNRATPSLVGFGPKSRYLGESAKNQEISNLKNTVGSLVRLAGRAFNDPEIQIEQQYITAPLVNIDGFVGVEVTYMGNKEKFTATQLIAMYLSKIRATASAELKLAVNDLVISCPAYFSDGQRRVVLDAAEIAGLKVLQLINETTAAALGWGITKTDLPDKAPEVKPRRIAFVDIGNSNYTVSIVDFVKGELKVRATAYDRHFGGRNFDKAIVDHFAKEFKEKFKVDINENLKARTRVAAACEKLKKVLSANASAPINIESLMNDVDVRGFLKREEMEELLKPLLDRATLPLEQALADAKCKKEDIDIIELVGGCTRVPALKNIIQDFFEKTLSFTLNQDEAVARGCAFGCAIWSPVFRVREFKIKDIAPYNVDFHWEPVPDVPDEEGTQLPIFEKGNEIPVTRLVTFYRKQPFDIEARYSQPDQLPGKVNPWIARFTVKGVTPTAKDDFMICKFKPKFDQHGILRLDQAYYVEGEEVAEDATPEEAENDDKQANGTPSDGAPPEKRKKKAPTVKGYLPMTAASASLDEQSKMRYTERENTMFSEDKLVADTEEKKNALEEFIYELRGHLDERYNDFASEEEKEKVREKLTQSEDWLYDEGEDATKAVYISKMEEIRFVAGPIIQRYNDKLQAERQARLEVEEKQRKAEEEKRRKAEEEKKKVDEAIKAQKAKENANKADVEMRDAVPNTEGQMPDGMDEDPK